MTASDDRSKEKIRQETGRFGANVVLVKPDERDAPSLEAVDDREFMRNFSEVMIKVTSYLRKAGIKNIDQDKLVREGTVMPIPVSGKIVFTNKVNQNDRLTLLSVA